MKNLLNPHLPLYLLMEVSQIWVVKDGVRRIPGIGWVLAMSRNIFIKRNWVDDVKIIDTMLDFYDSIKEEESKQFILFPEGTNINAKYLN